MANRKNVLTTLFLGCLLLTSCGSGIDYSEGEWYGIGFDPVKPRTSFLVGEVISPSDFEFVGYHEGEEVIPDPSEITVSPSVLKDGDDKLTFKWKDYTYVLDIEVTRKIVSQCFEKEAAIFAYIEPEHVLNSNGRVPDENNPDDVVDERVPTIGRNWAGDALLQDVSANSHFEYSYKSDTTAKMQLFATLCPNRIIYGKTIFPEYTFGVERIEDLDLNKFVTLENNGIEYPLNTYAYIKGKRLQTDEFEEVVKNFTGSASTLQWKYWQCMTDYALLRPTRVRLGEIDIQKGVNNIKINLGRNGGGTGYGGAANGNWLNIEAHYLDEKTSYETTNVIINNPPRTNYLSGEEFSLEGAEFVSVNSEGIEKIIPLDEIKLISNKKLTTSGDFEIEYNGFKFSFPVTVSSSIKIALDSMNFDAKAIKYLNTGSTQTKLTYGTMIGLDYTYLERVAVDSYFEYEIYSSDGSGYISINANIAPNCIWTNPTITQESWLKDKWNNGYTHSADMPIKNLISLTNIVDNVEKTDAGQVNQTEIIKGHVLNETDDLETIERFRYNDGVYNTQSSTTYIVSECFQDVNLGKVKLHQGNNVIRIKLLNSGLRNFGSTNDVACGNWKDITINFVN